MKLLTPATLEATCRDWFHLFAIAVRIKSEAAFTMIFGLLSSLERSGIYVEVGTASRRQLSSWMSLYTFSIKKRVPTVIRTPDNTISSGAAIVYSNHWAIETPSCLKLMFPITGYTTYRGLSLMTDNQECFRRQENRRKEETLLHKIKPASF